MLKSIITLIVTLIVGVVFMAIGNDFLNGSTDLKLLGWIMEYIIALSRDLRRLFFA